MSRAFPSPVDPATVKARTACVGDHVRLPDGRCFVVMLVIGGRVRGYVVRDLADGDAFTVHDLRGLTFADLTIDILDHEGVHCEDCGCVRVDGICGRFS